MHKMQKLAFKKQKTKKNCLLLKYVFSFLTVFIFSFNIFAPVLAESLQERYQKIDKLQKEIDQLQGNLDQKSSEIKSLEEEIDVLDTKITESVLKIEKMKIEIEAVNEEIVIIEKEIEQKEEEIRYQEQVLNKCIEILYSQSNSLLEILLTHSSLSEALSQIEYLESLEGQAKNNANLLKELKDQLENKRKEIEEKKNKLIELKLDFEEENIYLEYQRQEKRKLLSEKQSEYAALEDQLESASQNLLKEIIQLQKLYDDAPAASGLFIWPVKGTVTSSFGMRFHPILKSYRMHYGIDIGAPTGTPIKAAQDGFIVVSKYGYNGGFGNYIMIYHGGSLSTLYAHCNSLVVKENQRVKKGDIIGFVGTTGLSSGSHLHFGVIFSGEYIDPLRFLPKI